MKDYNLLSEVVAAAQMPASVDARPNVRALVFENGKVALEAIFMDTVNRRGLVQLRLHENRLILRGSSGSFPGAKNIEKFLTESEFDFLAREVHASGKRRLVNFKPSNGEGRPDDFLNVAWDFPEAPEGCFWNEQAGHVRTRLFAYANKERQLEAIMGEWSSQGISFEEAFSQFEGNFDEETNSLMRQLEKIDSRIRKERESAPEAEAEAEVEKAALRAYFSVR